jgi:hypothetical protein
LDLKVTGLPLVVFVWHNYSIIAATVPEKASRTTLRTRYLLVRIFLCKKKKGKYLFIYSCRRRLSGGFLSSLNLILTYIQIPRNYLSRLSLLSLSCLIFYILVDASSWYFLTQSYPWRYSSPPSLFFIKYSTFVQILRPLATSCTRQLTIPFHPLFPARGQHLVMWGYCLPPRQAGRQEHSTVSTTRSARPCSLTPLATAHRLHGAAAGAQLLASSKPGASSLSQPSFSPSSRWARRRSLFQLAIAMVVDSPQVPPRRQTAGARWRSARRCLHPAPTLALAPCSDSVRARTRQHPSRFPQRARRPWRSIFQLHATCIGIQSSLSYSILQVSNSSTSLASSKNPENLDKTTNPAWCSPRARHNGRIKNRSCARGLQDGLNYWWAIVTLAFRFNILHLFGLFALSR